MGYEIIFSYKEEVEKGVYADEIKTKKVKIGSSEDNLGLEAAAGRIFAQFARRNILVTDVEIWEYSKKKLSFKETDDGFVIKNRKFRFDDGPALAPSEELFDEQQVLDLLRSNPQFLAQLTGRPAMPPQVVPNMAMPLQPITLPLPAAAQLPPADPNMTPQQRAKQLEMIANQSLRPGQDVQLTPQGTQPHQRLARILRWEVYDPDPVLLQLSRQAGMAFTSKKRYPIYGEKMGKTATDGMIYTTIDDTGQQRTVSDRYFIGPQAQLEGEGEFIEDATGVVEGGGPEPRLMFESQIDDSMPVIRR